MAHADPDRAGIPALAARPGGVPATPDAPLPLHDRARIADHIVARLTEAGAEMRAQFTTPGRIPSCHLDDLLPVALAEEIHASFPPSGRMTLRRSVKENKFVSAQMDRHPPILEEAIFAFQDPRVMALVGGITGIPGLEPDPELYAGGISAMPQGAYLKPHLDNSHDGDQRRYRALNLLYYVTPDWRLEHGGNFELWDQGPKGQPRTIVSAFNRLVIMITNRASWHSVSEVRHARSRCCVSNYYFTAQSPDAAEYFHATSFRARPGEEALKDAVMQADNRLRTTILRVLRGRFWRNPHAYRRPPPPGDKAT